MNDHFGNFFEYWVCAESIDFIRKDEDWHSAIFPYSRVCLLIDDEQIK